MHMRFYSPAVALAGGAATASGNGLARFAYVPLFPAMVQAGWVDGGQAGILGAVALAGYLFGTLAGGRVARGLGVPRTLDLGMALVVLSLAACAWNGGFWWLVVWRGLAGIAGGLLMALAGPATLASVPPERRGAAGGIVIAGVGLGLSGGALLVPAMLPMGLAATWLATAGAVLALWLLAHRFWPDMRVAPSTQAAPPRAVVLLVTYGLHSAGMVPPMIYLADLAARGLGLGVTAGAIAWLLFGLGGMIGGILSGRVADRMGSRPTLLVWIFIQVVALSLCLAPYPGLVLPAAAIAGFSAMGTTTVTLTVCREFAPLASVALWVRCTAIFGIVQTAVAFALAALFAATGESHFAVFAAGVGFSVGALGLAGLLVRQALPGRLPVAPGGKRGVGR